ncbi:proton-coupled zinc antiporter SLC30A1-like [Styela clava]
MAQNGKEQEQQRRLMVDGHSGEDSGGEDAVLYRTYDEGGGLCKKLLKSKTGRLVSMLILIIGYFFTELIVGHITNSLTLVADSFHMLSDALSLIVALVAVRMSRRTARDPFRPWPSKEPYFNTFGWVRFEILGALINSTFLLALCISITLEAVQKFTKPEHVDSPKLVLAVGGGGLLINIFGLIMFGSHSHGHSHDHGHGHGHNKDSDKESDTDSPKKKAVTEEQHLNMRAVFLHVLGDALGSVIVMISATVLWLVPAETNPWTLYMDPTMSLILVCIMVFTTIPLFKQSSMILLETVPKHIKLESIRNKIKQIAGIQAIHDLHIWQLTGDKIVATVHVQCADAETYERLVQKIKASLHDEGIHSCTVQPEFSFSEDELPCQLVCGESCIAKTCCPPDKPKLDRKPSANDTRVMEQTTLTMAPSNIASSSTLAIVDENEVVLSQGQVTEPSSEIDFKPEENNTTEKGPSA